MSEPGFGDGVYRHEVEVRFHDLDAMGHAHHSMPLIYVEEARAAMWRALTGRSNLDSIDYVLGEVAVRFHAPIRHPALLAIELRVTRIGERSFEISFEVLRSTGELLASGRTVQVMYDYAARRSKPMPDAVRARLEALLAAAQKARPMPAETSPISAPST